MTDIEDPFVGRREDLARLDAHLAAVRDGEARLVSVRGRRQAGKSRLITEFVDRSGLPYLFTTGSRQGSQTEDIQRFTDDARLSCTLPGREVLVGGGWDNWEQVLRAIAAALPTDGPAIVVFDEFPWLLDASPSLEGSLQKVWDRVLEARPVLFILVGSDLAVMEMLTQHNRPLFGRAKEMVVNPFHVGDTAHMLDLGDKRAAEVFDAHLITGGYPRLLRAWRRRQSLRRFVEDQLEDENSDLAVVGQRVISAEFPSDIQAARVLRAIGAGERTFKNIGSSANVENATLSRALDLLAAKRVVVVDQPTSLKTAREPRYRVADPYLRFWLRFVEPALPDVARGRPDLAHMRVWDGWLAYRGRAIEPIVREALTRLGAEGAGFVGGWWTRTNNPEVDLVGVDRAVSPRKVSFVGSIKWRETEPFTAADAEQLAAHRAVVPGAAAAPLVAVSRSGATAEGVISYPPHRLLEAWP